MTKEYIEILEQDFINGVILSTSSLLVLVRYSNNDISSAASLEISTRIKILESAMFKGPNPVPLSSLPDFHTVLLKIKESLRTNTLILS